ncbi:AMP-binding protein [Streptomyces globosus]|uniref:AMP-binding protein n=1 Tax=Streptomyces globosus TaxID=68209 RepID=UPI00319EBB98
MRRHRSRWNACPLRRAMRPAPAKCPCWATPSGRTRTAPYAGSPTATPSSRLPPGAAGRTRTSRPTPTPTPWPSGSSASAPPRATGARRSRVGIWAPHRAEWTLTQYATAKIGAILVTVNPAYRALELGYAVRQSGMRLLIAAERFKTSEYAAVIAEVRPNCPALEFTVLLDGPDYDVPASIRTA